MAKDSAKKMAEEMFATCMGFDVGAVSAVGPAKYGVSMVYGFDVDLPDDGMP